MTTLCKMINGVLVELTANEKAEYFQRESEWEAAQAQQAIDDFTKSLEDTINLKASEKSYNSGASCASYANSTNPQWAAEAAAFIAWRDNCYEYSYDYLEKAQNAQIANPTIEDFISGLPAMEWPITQ